jgi:co-chaperonin GroES (HSP10)
VKTLSGLFAFMPQEGTMKQLEATGHYILVRPDKVKEKTSGGLYVPERAQDEARRNCYKGQIVSIGPVAFKDFAAPWGVEVGDRVIFAAKGGLNIEADPDELRAPDNEALAAINDEDVIAVYRNKGQEPSQFS